MAADPFLTLHREHESIRKVLRSLEAALDAAMNRDRATASDLSAIRDAAAYLRTTGEAHLRREERALLAPLEERIGRHGTLVGVIAYDHDEVRRETRKLEEALAAVDTAGDARGAELRELNRHGIFLVQYFSLHMAKEDSALADLARQILGEDGLAEVARRLEAPG